MTSSVDDLEFFRSEHGKIARIRDDGLCQYHLRLYGVNYPASDMHHMQGRAAAVDMRETWLNRLSLCRDCHNKYHRGEISRYDMERVARDANKDPVRYWFAREYIKGIDWAPEIKMDTDTKYFVHECVGHTACTSDWLVWMGDFGICTFCLYGFNLIRPLTE